MSKRPSIVGDLLTPNPTPAATAEVVTLTPPKKPKLTENVVRTSIYPTREAHDRLREIAFHERAKIHDLIMEGIDLVIAKRGHQESASRKPKAS